MKKLVTLLLAAVMTVGMCSAVFADNASLTKKYTATNADTTSPAEKFAFSVTPLDVTDAAADVTSSNMPVPTIGTADYVAGGATTTGATANVTLTMPTYTSVGIYYYAIGETAGSTPGVAYDSSSKVLKVVVVNGDNGTYEVSSYTVYETLDEAKAGSPKDDGVFENVYSAGKITIKKTVTGNLGDKQKYFAVTVTLSGGTSGAAYNVTGGSKIEDGMTACTSSTITEGVEKTFYIKDNETLTIANVPYGVTYTVDEADYKNYKASGEVTTEEEVDSATEIVIIVNDYDSEVPTGITTDSLPYILLGVVALGGLAVFFARKRFEF